MGAVHVIAAKAGVSTSPPPPPAGFTDIVDLKIGSHDGTHPVIVGVPVAPGMITDVNSIRLTGGIVGQVDNVSKDNNGDVRFFALTVIAPTGTYTVSASADAETAPAVTWADDSPTTVVISSAVDTASASLTGATMISTSATAKGYWKQGPVVSERVLHHFPGGGTQFHTSFRVSKYANGQSRQEILVGNGLSIIGGSGAPKAATYSVAISGPGSETFTGVKHHPHSRFVRRYGITPVHANIVPLGWSGTAEDGTWAYFKSTRMFQNLYRESALNSMTPITSTADEPFAVTTGAAPTPDYFVDGSIGYFSRPQGSPGANADIGPHPDYYMDGLRHFTPNGKTMILWHADKRQEAPHFWLDSTTKGFHRFDTGLDYNCYLQAHVAFDARTMGAFSGATLWNQFWDWSHWGAHFYIPYLVSGELLYLEGQCVQQLMNWAGNYSSQQSMSDYGVLANGSQLTRHPANFEWDYNDQGSSFTLQPRTQGHAVRTTVHTLAMMPEDETKTLALFNWDKTMVRTQWANVQNNLKMKMIDQLTADVVVPQSPSEYTSARFLTNGIHNLLPSGGIYKTWMYDFLIEPLVWASSDLAQNTPDGTALAHWLATTSVQIVNNTTDGVPEFLMAGELSAVLWESTDGGWQDRGAAPYQTGTGPATTLAELYRGTANENNYQGLELYYNIIPGTMRHPTAMTVSVPGAATGTAVTFSITKGSGEPDCFPNPANYGWYVNKYVVAHSNDDSDFDILTFGVGIIITSITGPNSGAGIVSRRPSDYTSIVNLPNPIVGVRLGFPAPGDWTPFSTNIGEGDYIGHFLAKSALFKDLGVTGADDMHTAMVAFCTSRGIYLTQPNHAYLPR